MLQADAINFTRLYYTTRAPNATNYAGAAGAARPSAPTAWDHLPGDRRRLRAPGDEVDGLSRVPPPGDVGSERHRDDPAVNRTG